MILKIFYSIFFKINEYKSGCFFIVFPPSLFVHYLNFECIVYDKFLTGQLSGSVCQSISIKYPRQSFNTSYISQHCLV